MIITASTYRINNLQSVEMGIFKEVSEAGKSGRIQYKKGFEFPQVVDMMVREGDSVLMVEDLTARVLMAQLFSSTGKNTTSFCQEKSQLLLMFLIVKS